MEACSIDASAQRRAGTNVRHSGVRLREVRLAGYLCGVPVRDVQVSSMHKCCMYAFGTHMCAIFTVACGIPISIRPTRVSDYNAKVDAPLTRLLCLISKIRFNSFMDSLLTWPSRSD
eukprot:6198786-Pleurochrysis_carterae.AAC.1